MKRISLNDGWQLIGPSNEHVYTGILLPVQVHDVLLERGKIINPNITGWNEDRWIGEVQWTYQKTFYVGDNPGICNLKFEGIDTFADIMLNGRLIGRNESAYMPLYLENIPLQANDNLLEVKIYPPAEILDQIELPEKYGDRIVGFCKARVFRSGLSDYSGPKPDLVRMGIYGNVILEQVEDAGFKEVVFGTHVNSRLDEGRIQLDLVYCEKKWDIKLENEKEKRFRLVYEVYDPENRKVYSGKRSGKPELLNFLIEKPQLWYPRTHGEQKLYRIVVALFMDEVLLDRYEKIFGFRRVEQKGCLNFYINDLPVKIYGANLVHADTITGCYPKVKQRLYELLDLAELGRFNCLRVWGEGEILDDDFYEECDRRGILLWQDFYLGYNMYSEEPDMAELCREEAELLIKRLKHHPSILLWCGGNEMYWSRDMLYPGEYCFGETLITEIYPAVCRRIDPERYYHCSSPSGGRFSNDPLEGDTHGYTHLWFVPGREYPVFLSENCRVSAPPLRTMKKMMTEKELWPEGYQNLSTKHSPLCWPKTWSDHNTNIGEVKTGPIEHYFEAENAAELIYRLGAAHSEYIKGQVERFRRGRSVWNVMGARRTKGHLLWKFNNNSNIISYGIVDYFNEPLMSYYALKRAYEPFQISFSIEDSIGVWAVNDTPERQAGSVCVSLLNLEDGKENQKKSFAFSCDPDESVLLGNLDSFGQFIKNTVLVAEAYSASGDLLTVNTDYTEIERRLVFSKSGKIEARMEDDALVLCADTFVRSVELIGDEDGDEFGWIFEDNYFDLFPGREKRVRLCGKHRSGKISIQPYYWEHGVEVCV